MTTIDPASQTMTLKSGYQVEASTAPDERLSLRSPDGRMCLTIALRPEGPVVEVAAAALAVTTEGDLRLDAGRLEVHARDGIALSSAGEIRLRSEDDVHVDGRFIKLNCPDSPALSAADEHGARVDHRRVPE